MTDLNAVYRFEQFIDTFALGHYARVLNAYDLRHPGAPSVAFKVLRPEHLAPDGDIRWEYRAFANEATLLTHLSSSPQVVGLLDCGYIEAQGEAPDGGQMKSFGDQAAAFVRALPEFAERGWRPYLALENLPRTLNLLYLMRPDRPDQRLRLPSEEGLALALQFGEMLHMAHRMGIVYLDHKLEHIYWDGQRLQVIDLNSSRQIEGDPALLAQQIRLDFHNLCVGVLYPIFTGLAPQKMALRPQPGTREDAEARYSEILTLDFGVEPTLSTDIQDLLQAGAAQQIENADQFLRELRQVSAAHGWDFMDYAAAPASRDARARLRAGLQRLRQGQSDLREARDLFREALVDEGISEAMEAELRRLVQLLNQMLNQRVIP